MKELNETINPIEKNYAKVGNLLVKAVEENYCLRGYDDWFAEECANKLKKIYEEAKYMSGINLLEKFMVSYITILWNEKRKRDKYCLFI